MALKVLSALKQKIKLSRPDTGGKLDYDCLPVLDANGLIQLTAQQGRLRNIRRIVKIDDKRYQILYQDVIEKYAELVQLMPASQAHHHAVPGGLFIHTLEVLELALTYRHQYKLPMFAPQEVQDKERYVWTYAVFVAVLLHDVGKRLTLCHFELDNGMLLEPFTEKLPLNQHYRIVFLDSKYHLLHEKIGLVFVSWLLPPIAQNFLLPRLHIMREIMAYVHGEEHHDGIIGKIIREADRTSTGRSLAHTDSRKFKGANLENMGERLMTQLRMLLASHHFAINKSNGNVYTSHDGHTYIISKTLADELRKTLQEDGKTDIPGDNNRIFDILQEHGFAETNDKGTVMHYIRRTLQGKTQTFSVLKFKTLKLFSVLPQPFEGDIVEVDSKNDDLPYAAKSLPEAGNQNSHRPEAVMNEHVNAETGNGARTTVAAILDDDPFAETENDNMPNTATERQDEAVTADPKAESGQQTNQDEAGIDLAAKFLEWCHNKIRNKDIVINQSSGVIQKVRYKDRDVIAVVTPRIFLMFGTAELGLPSHKSTAERIQKAIHAKKLNLPGPRGQIHRYKIKKSENNGLGENKGIHHYLFEIDKFCMDKQDVIEIISKVKNNENLALC